MGGRRVDESIGRFGNWLTARFRRGAERFAKRADAREVRTPSYANARSGVSIGVQTAWRNYAFLFKRQEARPLDRWVKRFGYDGL